MAATLPRPTKTGSLLRALCGAGLVTLFFSEFAFFNEDPSRAVIEADAPVGVLLSYGLVYAAFACGLSALLSVFAVLRWEGIVLAGCLFGWAVEGLLIPAVYEAVPLSFLWTSVGWHMPIDILLGLFGLLWAMRQGWVWSCCAAVGLGLFWACWTTWIWVDARAPEPDTFARYATWTGLCLVVGLTLLASTARHLWAMPRWGARATGAIALTFFVVTGAAHPGGALLLAVLVATCLWALRRLMHLPGHAGVQPAPLPWTRSLVFGVTPIVAALCYRLLWETQRHIVTEDVIFFLLFLSLCIFLWSLVRAFTIA